MNETEKNKRKKLLDDFSSKMLEMAINGINEAVAKKQVEVNYWRNKAYLLAGMEWKCQTHRGWTTEELDEYIEKAKCPNC